MSTTMLPHPTTSSFPSAIPAKNSGRPVERRMRIIFADPSGLQPLGVARENRADPRGKLAPLSRVERRRFTSDGVTGNDAKLLERGLVAGDHGGVALAPALERTRGAQFLDRRVVKTHQIGISCPANAPSALPFARQHVGGARNHAIGHRALRDVPVPSMPQRTRN